MGGYRSAHLRVCLGKVLPVWLAVLKHFMKKTSKASSCGTKKAVLRLPSPTTYNFCVNAAATPPDAAAHRSSNHHKKYRAALFKAMRCGSLKTDSLRFDTDHHQPEEEVTVIRSRGINPDSRCRRAAVLSVDTDINAAVRRSEDASRLLLDDLGRQWSHCCGGVNVDDGAREAKHLEMIRRINQQAESAITNRNYATGNPALTLMGAGTSAKTEGSEVDEARRYSTSIAENSREGVGGASSLVSDSELGDYSYDFLSRSSITIMSSSSNGDHDGLGMRIDGERKLWREAEIGGGGDICQSCSCYSTVTSAGGEVQSEEWCGSEDRRSVGIGGGGGESCCGSNHSTVTFGGVDLSDVSYGEAAAPVSAAAAGGGGGIMAVETDSEDPFFDFATSIAEIVISCDLTEEQQLEDLFLNYLRLNPPIHHPTIALAFFHVLQHLAH